MAFKDWMARGRAAQLDMAQQMISSFYGSGNNGHPLNENDHMMRLETLMLKAENALAQAKTGDRSEAVTASCNETFGELITMMHDVIPRYFKDMPLEEGEPVKKESPHASAEPPPALVTATVSSSSPRLLRLNIQPVGGEPNAEWGYRIFFGVYPPGGATMEQAVSNGRYLMNEPASGEYLPHSLFTRRSSEQVEFAAQDSGWKAYFSIRYENSKGRAGHWGPVFSAVIP